MYSLLPIQLEHTDRHRYGRCGMKGGGNPMAEQERSCGSDLTRAVKTRPRQFTCNCHTFPTAESTARLPSNTSTKYKSCLSRTSSNTPFLRREPPWNSLKVPQQILYLCQYVARILGQEACWLWHPHHGWRLSGSNGSTILPTVRHHQGADAALQIRTSPRD